MILTLFMHTSDHFIFRLIIFLCHPRAIFVYIISVWCFPSGIHNALSTIRYLVEIIPGTTKPNPSSLHASFRIDIEPAAKCFIPQPADFSITILVKCPPIALIYSHIYAMPDIPCFWPSDSCYPQNGATSHTHPASSDCNHHWPCCWLRRL